MAEEPKKRKTASEKRKLKTLEQLAREREYETIKEDILERDKDNRQKIAVLQTSDGEWWKLFDHSGAYWAFLLAPQVGKKHVKFVPDTDPQVKARYGVATVKNIEDFEANMVRLGVEKISDQGRLKIFKMKKKLSDAEAEVLILTEEERRKEANRLFKPKEIMPDLCVEVIKLSNIAIYAATNIERTLREAYGAGILKSAQKIASDFVRMANGWKEPEDYFEQTIYALKDMQADLYPVSNAKLISVNQAFQLAKQIEIVRRQVLKEATKKKKTRERTEERAKSKTIVAPKTQEELKKEVKEKIAQAKTRMVAKAKIAKGAEK